jgi:hypothetical protein
LRGIRRNHFDVQLAHSPTDLRHPLPIHDLSCFRRQPEMAAAIGVQSAENTALLHHFA